MCNIITLPHQSLRMQSANVTDFAAAAELAEKMKKATLDWEATRKNEVGVALAAVQINEMLRVVVLRKDADDKLNKEFDTLINPKIVKKSGHIIEDLEGCLSIKNLYGKVPRHEKVRVSAKDLEGNDISVTASGFRARVLQHEIDHTNGVVFVDHIKHSREAFFRLTDSGKMISLDYEKEIESNEDLWQA